MSQPGLGLLRALLVLLGLTSLCSFAETKDRWSQRHTGNNFISVFGSATLGIKICLYIYIYIHTYIRIYTYVHFTHHSAFGSLPPETQWQWIMTCDTDVFFFCVLVDHLSMHRQRRHMGKEGQVLQRSKRGWVWNQFFVIEEYTGPDPVLVGRVSNTTLNQIMPTNSSYYFY